MLVAWDKSHGEFLIEDYYYFSKLKKYAKMEGIVLEQVESFDELWKYDVIIFNYPEEEFSKDEIEIIINSNKKVILLAYYSNIDGVAKNINKVVSRLGIKVEYDVVVDEERNDGDPMFPLAFWKEKEVVMPCSASIKGGEPIVSGKKVFASKKDNITVFGTCVFWDNYSINRKNNKELALSILKGY